MGGIKIEAYNTFTINGYIGILKSSCKRNTQLIRVYL
jgi:hypothetical protein